MMLSMACEGSAVPEATISTLKALQPVLGATHLAHGAYRLSRSDRLVRWAASMYLKLACWYEGINNYESFIVGEILPAKNFREGDNRTTGSLHSTVKREGRIFLARVVTSARLKIHDVFFDESFLAELKANHSVHRPWPTDEVLSSTLIMSGVNIDQANESTLANGSIEMYHHWRRCELSRMDFLSGPGHCL
jgi:hypothetical protein